jgi:hypothetical protein
MKANGILSKSMHTSALPCCEGVLENYMFSR